MASRAVRHWWFVLMMSIACAAMAGCITGTQKPARVGDAASDLRQAPADSAPVAPPYDNKLDPAGELAKFAQVPDYALVYKHVEGYGDLKVYVYSPPTMGDTPCRRTVVLLIHGGGWGVGSPHMLATHAAWLRDKGYVAITVQYRLMGKDNGVTPFECVQDVRSAMRFVRAHACRWAGDSKRIVALGESAGGHLAAACALLTDINDPHDDRTVSARPDALLLYNPVLDTAPPDGWKWTAWSGEGGKKVAPRAKELSPTDHVVTGAPRTLIIHGDKDDIAPLRWSEAFVKKMIAANNHHTELIVLPGRRHAFAVPGWGDEKTILETLEATWKFLRDNGFTDTTGEGTPGKMEYN